jgi:hypothetical protein
MTTGSVSCVAPRRRGKNLARRARHCAERLGTPAAEIYVWEGIAHVFPALSRPAAGREAPDILDEFCGAIMPLSEAAQLSIETE